MSSNQEQALDTKQIIQQRFEHLLDFLKLNGIFGSSIQKELQKLKDIFQKYQNENLESSEFQIIQQSLIIFIKSLEDAQLDNICTQFVKNWIVFSKNQQSQKDKPTVQQAVKKKKKKQQSKKLISKLKDLQDKFFDKGVQEKVQKLIMNAKSNENLNSSQKESESKENKIENDKQEAQNQEKVELNDEKQEGQQEKLQVQEEQPILSHDDPKKSENSQDNDEIIEIVLEEVQVQKEVQNLKAFKNTKNMYSIKNQEIKAFNTEPQIISKEDVKNENSTTLNSKQMQKESESLQNCTPQKNELKKDASPSKSQTRSKFQDSAKKVILESTVLKNLNQLIQEKQKGNIVVSMEIQPQISDNQWQINQNFINQNTEQFNHLKKRNTQNYEAKKQQSDYDKLFQDYSATKLKSSGSIKDLYNNSLSKTFQYKFKLNNRQNNFSYGGNFEINQFNQNYNSQKDQNIIENKNFYNTTSKSNNYNSKMFYGFQNQYASLNSNQAPNLKQEYSQKKQNLVKSQSYAPKTQNIDKDEKNDKRIQSQNLRGSDECSEDKNYLRIKNIKNCSPLSKKSRRHHKTQNSIDSDNQQLFTPQKGPLLKNLYDNDEGNLDLLNSSQIHYGNSHQYSQNLRK